MSSLLPTGEWLLMWPDRGWCQGQVRGVLWLCLLHSTEGPCTQQFGAALAKNVSTRGGVSVHPARLSSEGQGVQWFRAETLELKISALVLWLCGLGHVAQPLSAFIFSSVT